MVAAKKGLARRAFQDVPRDLRRRTGSHNPQRVPKRLRMQARNEAKEDNTPIAKNKSGSGIGKGKKKFLRKEGIEKSRKAGQKRKAKDELKVSVTAAELAQGKPAATGDLELKDATPKRKRQPKLAVPGTPPSRFRRRQVHKTWLPTHVWHAKRATMTPPKEPLWRFALPLKPILKSYRYTHRAVTQRGAIAWDMSYMATIGLEGVEASIVGLLKGLRFAEEDRDKIWQERGLGKKWREGTRIWEGWIHEREGKVPRKIAQTTVIWSVQEPESKKRKAFIRVHPSAFLQLWTELTRIAKVQKPAVTVEDLRFEIGSIEIVGPAAAETLCSVLTPSHTPQDSPQSIWPTLASITDAGVLPPHTLLAFPCSDPRLRDPPRTASMPQDQVSQTKLTETLAYWPVDKTQSAPAIFNRNARLAAGRCMPSQQSVNRRKTAATPGQYPEARSTDPQIPILTYISSKNKSWTILLPWKCVLPVWRGITRYPVSTGGNPMFGGLKELRQINYERSRPSFPYDCPGTDAGWAWELQQREERKHEWTKRPKGKRIEWTSLDLGNGRKGELGDPWACSWELLAPIPTPDDPKAVQKLELTASPFQHMPSNDVSNILAGRAVDKDSLFSIPSVFTVKITMVQRGVPTTCARIYRLPTNNPELRSQWLALAHKPKSAASSKPASGRRSNPNSNPPNKPLRNRALAASLLQQNNYPKAGEDKYPIVPDEEDLVGFVTTGNYNLAEGMPTAVANLVADRVLGDGDGQGKEKRFCIVREAGQELGRLAMWEVV